MTPSLKYGLLLLLLCTIAFLIFVNFVENNIVLGTYNIGQSRTNDSITLLTRKEIDKKFRKIENLEYKLRPVCSSSWLVWVVTSYAGDPSPRSALRRAYEDEELQKLGVKRVFLLGLLDKASERKTGVTQAAIESEFSRFQDVLQGNFNEAYRNLTLKHLMGLKWATEDCPQASYVIKQDDDIVLNLFDILKRLKVFKANQPVLAGYALKNMKPVREPANKWFVTQEEFPEDSYPEFLSGWLYIASRDVAEKIVERCSTRKGKLFWIDDLFLTGIIRRELDIPLTDMREMYTTDYRFLNCCIRGKEKRLKCEFSVGPNGGKVELQMAFRDFAAFCEEHCDSRPPRLSVGKTCVVEYEEESRAKMGSAKIEPIQFL